MKELWRKTEIIRWLLIAAALVALATLPAGAAGVATDHESLYPGDTATGITATLLSKTTGAWQYQKATGALISVEDNAVRFRYDGGTPTNTTGTSADSGHKLYSGDSYKLRGYDAVKNFLCLDAVSGSRGRVKVSVEYGGE